MRPLGEIDFACGSFVLWSLVIVSYGSGRGTSRHCRQKWGGGGGGPRDGQPRDPRPQALAVRLDADLALEHEDRAPLGYFGSKATKHVFGQLYPSLRLTRG